MPEQLTMLNPRGVDFKSVGRGSVRSMSSSEMAACLCDLTPIQELIVLSINCGPQPGGEGIGLLYDRLCSIKSRERWKLSKKDKRRDALLLLTTIGFYSYISPTPPKIGQMAQYLGISRQYWHRNWSKRYKAMMTDFNDYLSEQERDGNRAFYRRYMSDDI